MDPGELTSPLSLPHPSWVVNVASVVEVISLLVETFVAPPFPLLEPRDDKQVKMVLSGKEPDQTKVEASKRNYSISKASVPFPSRKPGQR